MQDLPHTFVLNPRSLVNIFKMWDFTLKPGCVSLSQKMEKFCLGSWFKIRVRQMRHSVDTKFQGLPKNLIIGINNILMQSVKNQNAKNP